MNNESKKEETNLDTNNRISTDLLLQNIPVDELLGSVTTYTEKNDKNQALRSSARVFKKIKLDANLLSAPIPEKLVTDKKEDLKADPSGHKEPRKLNISWATEEVTTLFFEALNENGKDFDRIHSSITQKLSKKGITDQFTKEHVRHIYHRTWHKISKYLKFSEGVKRTVQELYGLINYGELRKKVPSTPKIYFKLNELVHQGSVTLRAKGKMVRVRTPMCATLRRLNKLDDKDDDFKLPPKVIVQLQPKTMQAFLKVQSFALNPRIKTELPLQKKLSSFIQCVSKRWRAAELDYLKNNFPIEEISTGENDDALLDIDARLVTSQLKFTPPKGVKLNLPRTEVCDFITKENISLNAYEERMGFDNSKLNDKVNCKKTQKSRTDSLSEIITKPVKSDGDQHMTDANLTENLSIQNDFSPLDYSGYTSSAQEDCHLAKDNSEIVIAEVHNPPVLKEENLELKYTSGTIQKRVKKENELSDLCHTNETAQTLSNNSVSEAASDNNLKKLDISVEEQLCKLDEIRNGWTIEDCDNLTIGELYLMFGSSSKLILEYHWVNKTTEFGEELSTDEHDTKTNETDEKVLNNFGFSDTLRKLVDIMKMQQKKTGQKCSCGNVLSPKSTASKKSHTKNTEIEERPNLDEKVVETESCQLTTNSEDPKTKVSQFEDFVKPQSRPPSENLIAQLDSIEKLKPKYSIRKGRRQRTKQLVVERELPLMPKASSGHQIVCMNIISHVGNNSNDQSAHSVDDQDVNVGATECDNHNNFDQISYMEENYNCFADNIVNSTPEMGMDAEDTPNLFKSDHLEGFLDPERSLSPTVILKENEHQWISSEVADFSLSSFLGHLESPMKTDDNMSNDVDCQLRSLLTENSFDYTAKFADLANKVVGDMAN